VLRRLILAAMLIIVLSAPAAAYGQVINASGAGGAPVSVGTLSAVAIMAGDPRRISWAIFSESSDLRCTVGGADNSAPAIEPSASLGFIIKAGQYMAESGRSLSMPAQARLDCIALTGTTNVDTWEEK